MMLLPPSKHRGMAVEATYICLATLLLATKGVESAVIQAAVDVSEDNELLKMIFHQIEMLGNKRDNQTYLSQDLASALLQVAPIVTIKGNITDPHRRLVVSFTVQASKLQSPVSYEGGDLDDDDVDEDEDWDLYDWRGSGGLLHPIVGVVEPYMLGLAELVFNGFLSSIISNFLESVTLVGDTRLV